MRKRFLSQREGSRDIAGAFAFIYGIVRVCRWERSRRERSRREGLAFSFGR
ncbi:hypothetical protein ACQ1Q1_10255 [Ornithobacterium rhinotracheale]